MKKLDFGDSQLFIEMKARADKKILHMTCRNPQNLASLMEKNRCSCKMCKNFLTSQNDFIIQVWDEI